MFTNSKRKYSEKENDKVEHLRSKRVHHSSSIASLRHMAKLRRPKSTDTVLSISQPQLNDSSLEKMKNKVRQSPSMMDIKHTGEIELCEEANARDLEELLALSEQPAPPFTGEITTQKIDFLHHNINKVLKTIKIHQLMSRVPGIIPINSIRLGHLDDAKVPTDCTLEMPYTGIKLNDFQFNSDYEPVLVIRKIIETLSFAESEFNFEHRNLHAGNITISRNSTGQLDQVTILNCNLSRLSHETELYYTPLDNQEFYDAKLPVLYKMQGLVRNPSYFVPETNVLWIKYLCRFLMNVRPSTELKKIDDLLHAKWSFRRAPKSAAEVHTRLH